MRIARARLESGQIVYGTVLSDKFIAAAGSPFEQSWQELAGLEEGIPLSEVRLLAPVQPTKIIAVGRNYAAHAAEHGADVPAEPLIFLKPPSAVIGPGDAIVLPALSRQVEHEAELVAVVGRRSRHLSLDDATDCLLGYTCGNDVTARDLQRKDGQWSRAKGFDTFCPIGPWIDTDLDPTAQEVVCRVNGKIRQRGSTSQMVFDLAKLLVYISSAMTLEPGDLILTGTPAGVASLEAGDRVEVSISGLGTLANPVVSGREA